jgi:hypothetical protein
MRASMVCVVLAAVAGAGCAKTRPCKAGTVAVTLTLSGAAADADTIELDWAIDGQPVAPFIATRSPGGSAESAEIDFPSGYPTADQHGTLTAIARKNGSTVATAPASVSFAPVCTAVTVDLCDVLFVAPSGDDANSGCDPAAPKRTLGRALADARSRLPGLAEIHVCKGSYDESALTLDLPVTLRGGYDCAQWQRASQFGWPTFDATNETVIENGDYAASRDTLLINGDQVRATTIVEGFTIRGASAGAQGSNAVEVRNGAAPTLTDCRILGGSTSGISSFGSAGVFMQGSAAPDLVHDFISGGSGVTASPGSTGSIGVFIDNAAPHLHDSQISGGSGSANAGAAMGSIGSAAIQLYGRGDYTAAAGLAIERNQIDGGSATCGANDNLGGIGVAVFDSVSIDLIGNSITVGGDSYGCWTRGVHGRTSGSLRMVGNRIFGGHAKNNITNMVAFVWVMAGVDIEGASSVELTNNMIVGGQAVSADARNSWAGGVLLSYVKNALIRHNTISTGPGISMNFSVALVFFPGTIGTVVDNNILFGADGPQVPAFFADACATTGTLKSLRNNLIFSPNQLWWYGGGASPPQSPPPGTSCAAWVHYDTLNAVVGELAASGTQVSGNVTIRATCSASESGCIAVAGCTSGVACTHSIFDPWDDASSGVSTLFGDGWRLGPTVPCAVAQSSLDLLAMVPNDLFGQARTPPPSMGAVERDGSCQ